jgi:hypothetical protein
MRVAKTLGADLVGRAEWVLRMLTGDGGVDNKEHEDGIAVLGELLGCESSQPDRKLGLGPDVLWVIPDSKTAIGIEAKTGKKAAAVYRKNHDIGKIHNDLAWLEKNYPGHHQTEIIVGALVPVVRTASVPDGLRIVPMEGLVDLSIRVVTAAKLVAARSRSTKSEDAIETAFKHLGLLWPTFFDALPSTLAVDLQDDDDEPDAEE